MREASQKLIRRRTQDPPPRQFVISHSIETKELTHLDATFSITPTKRVRLDPSILYQYIASSLPGVVASKERVVVFTAADAHVPARDHADHGFEISLLRPREIAGWNGWCGD